MTVCYIIIYYTYNISTRFTYMQYLLWVYCTVAFSGICNGEEGGGDM